MAKKHKDFITEEDYTIEMAGVTSTRPEDDSPGDSEFDAGTETEVGVNFETDEDIDVDQIDAEVGRVDGDETTESSYARDLNQRDLHLPKNAEVVSSELPAPRQDQDSETAIH